MLGFLKPTSGEIKIDGQVLNNHNIESWQKKIGYVQQEVYLLDNTIAENIAFGLETEVEVNKTIESLSINDGITIVMIAHRETGLDFVNKIIRI